MSFINAIDSFLPNIFQDIANPFLDSLMVFVSGLGNGGLVWIVAIILLLISKKYRRVGVAAAVSLAVCFFTGTYLIKPLVGRIRPCNLYPDLRMLIPRPTDFSFPSMHSATAFSVAWVIWINSRKFGIPAIILSVLIAISRVYLNVHFTTDIICGVMYGILVAFFADFVIKKTKFPRTGY